MQQTWLELAPGEPVALVAQRVLGARLRELRKAMRRVGRVLGHGRGVEPAGEALSAEGEDPAAKAVHRLRVASRKSDVSLRTFRAYCDPKQWRQVRGMVRTVRRLAGTVRDADVHVQLLGPVGVASGEPRVGVGARSAAERIARERAEAMGKLHEACDDARVRALGARARRLERSVSSRSAFPVDLVARTTLAGLASDAGRFGPEDLIDLAKLHELRLAVKRLRYAMETFGVLIEGTTRDAAYAALEEAQKRLGDVNDVATLVDRFERYAADDTEGALSDLHERLVRVRDARHAKAAVWWRTSGLPAALRALRGVGGPLDEYAVTAGVGVLGSRRLGKEVAMVSGNGSGNGSGNAVGNGVAAVGSGAGNGKAAAGLNAVDGGHGDAKGNGEIDAGTALAREMPHPEPIAMPKRGVPDALAMGQGQRSLFLSGERVAAIDVGSNSLRLLAVELIDERSWRVLEEERAMTRLAHGLASTGVLAPEAMAASLEALVRFKATCDRLGVRVCRAFATAAVREARNGADFRSLVLDRTGLKLEIVSDRDEGRLVHRSVSRAFDLSQGVCAVADIGGGSLEVVVSDGGVIVANTSMPLGAVRLTEQFGGAEGSVAGEFAAMRRHATRTMERRLWKGATPPNLMVGCGGTFTTLMAMAAAARGVLIDRNSPAVVMMAPVSRQQIRDLIAHLRSLPLAQRLRAPGLPSDRADIIVAGFTVVDRLMKHLGATHVHVHPGGVRDGLILNVVDELLTSNDAARNGATERMQGVRAFAQRCRYERPHSEQVAMLSLSIYDQLCEGSSLLAGLGAEARERELLEAAAVLHDVGVLVEYQRHHKHSRVMIQHAELPGLSAREIEIVSLVARYHRRAEPTTRHAAFAALSGQDRELVERLAGILRLADGLDRSHAQRVRAVHLRFGAKTLTVEAEAGGASGEALGTSEADVATDVATGMEKAALLERLVGMKIKVEAR